MSTATIARTLGISPRSTMGQGYSGRRSTLDDMGARWDWMVLHDEMQRRHLALYFSHPGTVLTGVDADGLPILSTPMGSGSAGRAAGQAAVDNFWRRWSRTFLAGRPSRMTPEGRAWLKPGMAPIAYPGTSNHEADTWQGRAMAVDNVGWEDGWMGANVARFGLKTFWNVGSEPWHTQPAGLGNSKADLQADLRRYGLGTPELPAIPLAQPPTEGDDEMEPVGPGRLHSGEPVVFAAGETKTFEMPFDARWFLANITTARAKSVGFIAVWPDGDLPEVSSCQIAPDRRCDNLAVFAAGRDGHYRVYASAACSVFFDIQALER